MSKNKDAKRKANQKAKLAQAAQLEQARIEHIAIMTEIYKLAIKL